MLRLVHACVDLGFCFILNDAITYYLLSSFVHAEFKCLSKMFVSPRGLEKGFTLCPFPEYLIGQPCAQHGILGFY